MQFSRDSESFFVQWLRSLDKIIVFLLLSWISLGLLFCTTTTLSFASEKIYDDSSVLVNKYYVFIILGLVITFSTSIFNENFYKEFGKYIFLISVIFLIFTLVFGIEVKGSKRWINLYFFNLQPIELVKPTFVIFLAKIFSSEKSFNFKFIVSGIVTFILISILLLQPDYTQGLLVISAWLTVIFISGLNLVIIFSIIASAIIFMGSLLFLFKDNFSYIFLRFDKWLDVSSISYQSEKALDAIIYGGFFGRGIGEGVLSERIPESHTDYVLASIGEEFGIVAIIFILIIVFSLFMRVFAICQTDISNFKKYTLTTLSTLVLLQIFINVCVTLNLMPSTGMTFAFLSYGGSSILTSSFLMGVILSLTKKKYS